MDPKRMSVFFGTILITYLIIDILKILLAKRLNKKLTTKRIILMKQAISILMLIFGIILVLRGTFPEDMHEIEDNLDITMFQEFE